jgi:hypothetical protein
MAGRLKWPIGVGYHRVNGWREMGVLKVILCVIMVFAVALTGCVSLEDSKHDEAARSSVIHVAPSGSDSNDGSAPQQAFSSIQQAIDYFSETGGGCIIVHAGTYHERLLIETRHSGTDANPLIICGAPDEEMPVLDGSPLAGETRYSIDPDEYSYADEVAQLEMIHIADASYVRIEGFEICNNATPHGGWNAPMGILVSACDDEGAYPGIEIIGNKIHDIDGESWGYRVFEEEDEEYVCDMNGHGIAVYGETCVESAAISGIKIIGNEVYDNKLGQSESVVVNGNVTGFLIARNFVHDNDNIGIDVIGGEETSENMDVDCARSGIVEGNVVINNAAAPNQTYDEGGGCDGIYVDGGRDCVIRNNYVIGSDYCFEIGTENLPPFPRATGIELSNNILVDGDISAMIIGGTNGAKDNVIARNSIHSPSPYELGKNRVQKSPNTFADNVFVATDDRFDWPLSSDNKVTTSGFRFSDNVYLGGCDPDPEKHSGLQVSSTSPYQSDIDGRYVVRDEFGPTPKGCDSDEMRAAMGYDGFEMDGASLFEIASANHRARREAAAEAESFRDALNKVKGSPLDPIDANDLGGNLCEYLARVAKAPEGAIVGMKHAGETYEGGEDGEALNSIEDGAGKYYGLIGIGRGCDGAIDLTKSSARRTLTDVRAYYKVPYTYTVAGRSYTSWLVGQIDDICIAFDGIE